MPIETNCPNCGLRVVPPGARAAERLACPRCAHEWEPGRAPPRAAAAPQPLGDPAHPQQPPGSVRVEEYTAETELPPAAPKRAAPKRAAPRPVEDDDDDELLPLRRRRRSSARAKLLTKLGAVAVLAVLVAFAVRAAVERVRAVREAQETKSKVAPARPGR